MRIWISCGCGTGTKGAAEALATFYSAVKLAEEYDYIFCHNEAVLYEFVEKYAPELFEKIKKLVAAGKWHIMGGWYIQPDYTVPSGESFIRQITTGREYFEKKFGSRPKVAVNFDSFGHTRGRRVYNKAFQQRRKGENRNGYSGGREHKGQI